MTSKDLRQMYLDFFVSKGHKIIPSSSLLPENDPTTLFITAGMHPLVPYLMGEKHAEGKRLTDVQKCIRTNDIDEVGDRTHHTFFEMLGNWSLGDYFRKESIEWSWEFLTSPAYLNLDKNRLAVSVFAGDDDAPFDEEAFELWKKLGIPEKRIAKLPKSGNWWGPAGETGPCGADTEIFYWVGDPSQTPDSFNDDNDLWVEIWNNVFMEYNKKADGTYEPLEQKNVDTGMGLERILAIMNNEDDNYKTDLFFNQISKLERMCKKKYDDSDEIKNAMRIVIDHIKAATFIIGDDKGITPANTDQGYIVRRLIRRAIRYGKQLEVIDGGPGLFPGETWTKEISKIVIHDYCKLYPELQRNGNFIIEQFAKEEEKFSKTLERGLKEMEKCQISESMDPVMAFNLFQTYGFPLEMINEELLKKNCRPVTSEDFNKELEKHQDLSRTASAGKFKGGLADASEETKKLHTAAHLLLAALRKVLGDHVFQKGSNITAERLRFDFSHADKMTPEELEKVENLVNEAIGKNLTISCDEMLLDEAKAKNAMGVFESKYGERVKVYSVGQEAENFSTEICGGPHVEKTGELGKFKISKEESSGSGVRRIKAILE